MGVDLHVEVALGLEVGSERLAAFFHGFIVDADALVLGEEGFAGPGPDMRALNVDFDHVAGNDMEVNVGAIGVGVVLGAGQFYVRVEQAALLQVRSADSWLPC